MKLMLAIIADQDTEAVISSLIENKFRVTKVASTGGFLRKGNTTLLIGTEGKRVDDGLEIIRNACAESAEIGHHKATVFILDVASFKQL